MKLINKPQNGYSFLSLFSGAGGFDLGFEMEGFAHTESIEILPYCVETLRNNRPGWKVVCGDVCEYNPLDIKDVDVMLAGFPCQGFSLGGNRDPGDERNLLYKQVIRIAQNVKPRIIVLENVLNLRTMRHPVTNRPFALQIISELEAIGYKTVMDFFKVAHFGTPQTRRRFLFVAFLDKIPEGYVLPQEGKTTSIRDFVADLANGNGLGLPNHNPKWGFESYAHTATGEPFDPSEEIVPIRISRTASDGNPVRSLDEPFPAIDTATVWGWAQGHVTARRVVKDRTTEAYIRNPEATVKLWRISASRIRAFTAREYARLQTFPDDWVFAGANKREIQLQIGNAVPVLFAAKIAENIHSALKRMDGELVEPMETPYQLPLF